MSSPSFQAPPATPQSRPMRILMAALRGHILLLGLWGAPRLSSAMRAWELRGVLIVICLSFASKTPRPPKLLQRLCLAQPFLLPGLRL